LRAVIIEGYHRLSSKGAPMLLVVILASQFIAAPSPVAPEDPDLVRALAKYEVLDFRSALTDLQRAIKANRLSPRDTIETLAYMGRIHAVLNNTRWAQARFEQVLRLDPAYELSPDESPRIREVFVEAQKAAHPKGGGADGPFPLDLPPSSEEVVPAPPAGPPPTNWILVGGITSAVVAGIVAAILIGSSSEHSAPATVTWRLP
jgi:hypothetical protein